MKNYNHHLEENINLPKLELLVRLGLMPLRLLPILRRALSRVEAGSMLTPEDRRVIAMFLDKIMNITLDDPSIFQRMRTLITQKRNFSMKNNVTEADITLKRMPVGMLSTLATNVKSKERSGGKLSPEDKRVASRAKAELRRRRHNMRENYENAFLLTMQEYGISNIAELPSEHVKDFFNKVDQIYNSGE
jgi:hypothetical protein